MAGKADSKTSELMEVMVEKEESRMESSSNSSRKCGEQAFCASSSKMRATVKLLKRGPKNLGMAD